MNLFTRECARTVASLNIKSLYFVRVTLPMPLETLFHGAWDYDPKLVATYYSASKNSATKIDETSVLLM